MKITLEDLKPNFDKASEDDWYFFIPPKFNNKTKNNESTINKNDNLYCRKG